MVYRLIGFIPAALSMTSLLTWRDVVSGMLRMSYTSEVTDLLERYAGNAGRGCLWRVQLAANVAINARRADWRELYLGALSAESGVAVPELRRLEANWASLTDALKYIQLGSPENVIIQRTERSQKGPPE